MVKGVSRRIVVVRAPEQRMFEEAIFILRDDAMKQGVTAEDVVAQACGIASRYIRDGEERGRFWVAAAVGLLGLAIVIAAVVLWQLRA